MSRSAFILSIALVVLLAASLVLSGIALFRPHASALRASAKPGHRLAFDRTVRPNGPGVAVVTIYGPIDISSGSSPFDPTAGTGSDAVVRRLDALSRNPRIKAVILRINSPGGTIASVQEICQKIVEMKSKGVKFVASLGDVCASGGYYIACQADRVVSNPGTLTGSIGVIINGFNWSGLMKKAGVEARTIRSGKHKDMFSPYRPMTSEERRLLQSVVDDSFDQFARSVSVNRRIPMKRLALIADGRVFTGRQALRLGLVDELGSMESAVRAAGKLCGLGSEPSIYEEERSAWDEFLAGLGVTVRNRLGLSSRIPVQYGPVY
jgi:protease-4